MSHAFCHGDWPAATRGGCMEEKQAQGRGKYTWDLGPVSERKREGKMKKNVT